MMFATAIPAAALRPRGLALAMAAALLLFGAAELVAWEAPSAPFLEKNDFYLKSAGFKLRFASDPKGQEALRKLPAHRMVVHATPNGPRYLYADPVTCVCIFVGSRDNWLSYRDILAQPLPQADNVAPDYKSQAGALLSDDPIASDAIDWQPDSLSDAFQDYF